jgi:hypothetical protein
MTHYHVSRHASDDDIYCGHTVFEALDYAAGELATLAAFEYESLSITAAKAESYGRNIYAGTPDPDEMYDALRSFARSERYTSHQQNAENMVRQHNLPATLRAPLYRDYVAADPENPPMSGDERLAVAADHVIEKINDETPVSIWKCEAGLVYMLGEEDVPVCSLDYTED